jgi:SAM-dependent methyltransferase
MKTSGELEVDLKDESCDAILLFDVFHELYFPRVGERRRLLQALYRILRPNGLLIVHWCLPESKLREEINNSNFSLESEHSSMLIHHGVDLEEGQVLRFRKRKNFASSNVDRRSIVNITQYLYLP